MALLFPTFPNTDEERAVWFENEFTALGNKYHFSDDAKAIEVKQTIVDWLRTDRNLHVSAVVPGIDKVFGGSWSARDCTLFSF